MRNQICLAVVLGAGCIGACDDAGRGGEVTRRALLVNGPVLNSAVVNGWELNGFHLNGWELNGWQLNGWQLNGWQLNGPVLQGTLFSGTITVDGATQTVSGQQLIGSTIALTDGTSTYVLRIDDIALSSAPGGDVYVYDIAVIAPDGAVTSLCTDASGQPTGAIPLRHAWNTTTGARIDAPTAVTFACRGAVLAKCVEWGYRPWATATQCNSSGQSCQQISLQDHHQACTRMARADYCGDGTPHTFSGTPIDIYDRLSPKIQIAATLGDANWQPEAEWGPNGAVCVGDELRLKMFDDLDIDYEYPACLDAIDDFSNCGNLLSARGGKIADRYCSKWTDDPSECQGGDDDDDD